MDLLGGYGGSDSEPESPRGDGGGGRAVLVDSAPKAAPAAPSAAPMTAEPSQLLTSLPAPSGSKAPLFSGLPKPAQKKKVVVQFRVPITYDPVDVPEEEPARKKQRTSSKGRSLSELLPPPQHTAGGGRRLDAGAKGDGGGGGGGRRKYDSDEDEVVPGTEDRSGMVQLGPGDAPADAPAGAATAGNEAFRVDQQQGTADVAGAAAQWGATQQAQQAQWAQYYQQHGGHEYAPHQQAAAAAAAASAVDPAEALLQAALAAEREKAARRGQAGAAADIQIKEISGAQLKHMAPGQRAEVDALRNAFGADYEAKLRQEAGPDPSRLSKRRHQIGSLYHMAKQRELEQLDIRAAGGKSKGDASKKYGW